MTQNLLHEFWCTANPATRHSEKLTLEELQRQATFESLDYHKPYPLMYMKHLRQHYARHASSNESGSTEQPVMDGDSCLNGNFERAPLSVLDAVKKYDADERNEAVRWLLHVLIAISVGVMAMFMLSLLEIINDYRISRLSDFVQKHHVFGRFIGYLFFIGLSLAFLTVATGVVLFEPAAAGGGIPAVMAYLNGVHMPKAMNIRTFFVKSISCVCAVAGGLPVGLEAPLIHLGAIIGAGVTQGRSRTLGFQTKLFQAFRNNKDRRDFITAGAACGVSAAFASPIGGLLFVMEEVSSFWDRSASGQIFLATLVCFTTISIISSVLENQRFLGWVSNAVSVLFEVNLTIPLNLLSIVPSFFLGILCGVFAALFTKANLMLVKYRRRYVRVFPLLRFAEPLLIGFLYCTLSYFLALVPDCRPMYTMNSTSKMLVWGTENRTWLFTATCSEENTYSPMATLILGNGKENIRHLFSRQTIGEFSAGYIFLFLFFYTVFACWSSGTTVSGGLVVPSLVIGAAFGRLYGQFLWFVAARGAGAERSYWISQAWMDPGVFALIGAGAFLSGISRMTMSICVIMVELSSELHYLLPVMVAIIMAKTVADFISEPLYHYMLRLNSVPYLPSHLLRPEFEQLTVEDVMASDVVTLCVREKTSVVFRALQQTRHHAFPVVEVIGDEEEFEGVSKNNGDCNAGRRGGVKGRAHHKFVGLVTREDLQCYLALPALYSDVLDNDCRQESSLQTDNVHDGLLPRVAAVSKMTWTEWLTHKTSLYFVMAGGNNLPVVWSGSNNIDEITRGGDHDDSKGDFSALFPEERCLPRILDISLIANRSPYVASPFFNLQMAYHTFRTMGLRHMVVVDGDAVVGIVTRKDLLVDSLLQCVERRQCKADEGAQASGLANTGQEESSLQSTLHEEGLLPNLFFPS